MKKKWTYWENILIILCVIYSYNQQIFNICILNIPDTCLGYGNKVVKKTNISAPKRTYILVEEKISK